MVRSRIWNKLRRARENAAAKPQLLPNISFRLGRFDLDGRVQMQLSLLTLKAVRASKPQISFKRPLISNLQHRRSFHSNLHPPSSSPIPLCYRPTNQSRTRNLLRSNSSLYMQRRRQSTNSSTTTTSTSTQNGSTSPKHTHSHREHEHEDDHDHSHEGHSHSHGGIFHTHSHDHSAQDGQAEAVVKFMRGEGVDRGTKVTILGLLTNVGLTAVKGVAGWCVPAIFTSRGCQALILNLGGSTPRLYWRKLAIRCLTFLPTL